MNLTKCEMQIRYQYEDHHWQLLLRRPHGRWHRYTRQPPTPRLAALLDEIDNDPTGIFWG